MLANTHYAVGCCTLSNNSPYSALALVQEIVLVSSLPLCLRFFLSGMSALVALCDAFICDPILFVSSDVRSAF
jgi:hypothetical protein